jgi:hypothetical protein
VGQTTSLAYCDACDCNGIPGVEHHVRFVGSPARCIACVILNCLDFNLVVQPNLITGHSSDAPAMTGCLEDGDFNILRGNTGELRYAFIQQPNKQLLRFNRTPLEDADLDDDVTFRAILRMNEVFVVQRYETVKFLLRWIRKSFHNGGMDSLRYRASGIFQGAPKAEDFYLGHVIIGSLKQRERINRHSWQHEFLIHCCVSSRVLWSVKMPGSRRGADHRRSIPQPPPLACDWNRNWFHASKRNSRSPGSETQPHGPSHR